MNWIDELANDHARSGSYNALTPHTAYPGGILHWSGMAIESQPDQSIQGTGILLTTPEINRIRAAMAAKGLSINQAARKICAAASSISGWLAKREEVRKTITRRKLILLENLVYGN